VISTARTLVLFLALSILAAGMPARACSVCGCGDPLVAAAEGRGRGGDLRVAVDGEYLSQKAGTEGEPGKTDVLDQYTLRLTGVYSPVAALNLVATIPLLRKKMAMDGHDGTIVPVSDVTTLGDVELGARYFVVDLANVGARRRQGLAVSLGTSLPTGQNGATDAGGLRIDQHGQAGTGAFGPYAGLTYRLQQDPWSLLASASGRAHNENSYGYRFGSALLWTVQGQWSPLSWLALGLGVDGRNAGRDRQDGVPVENTGGLVLAATPSAYLQIHRALWLDARVQIPFYTRLVGEQSVGPTFVAGFLYEAF